MEPDPRPEHPEDEGQPAADETTQVPRGREAGEPLRRRERLVSVALSPDAVLVVPGLREAREERQPFVERTPILAVDLEGRLEGPTDALEVDQQIANRHRVVRGAGDGVRSALLVTALDEVPARLDAQPGLAPRELRERLAEAAVVVAERASSIPASSASCRAVLLKR